MSECLKEHAWKACFKATSHHPHIPLAQRSLLHDPEINFWQAEDRTCFHVRQIVTAVVGIAPYLELFSDVPQTTRRE